MKKKSLLIVSFILLFALLQAKDLKYAIKDIPQALKENVHTVMRLNQMEVEIKSEKLVVVTITEVRTILNKNGHYDSFFREMYSPMNKIIWIKGKLFDESGKQIKSYFSDDVKDFCYRDGFSLYQDNRVKMIDPEYANYPFTVEYTYQMEMKQSLFLPSWSHSPENTSFEISSYTLKVPPGYNFRYKEYNLSKPVVKSTVDGKEIYSWSLNNLKARVDEPLSSIKTPDFPLVRVAPNNFMLGETKGSAESWKQLGMWATTLITDKDKLPDATIAKVKELTTNCKTDIEKVKVIYEFMQQKTRYVNIAIGIGGWQPFDASTVDKNSYGDCKALSNYTHALLNAVGVKSFYTLVKAGSEADDIDESFPSSQFNHAFVCVPVEKDTIWLECTSQRLPCCFNSDFTDDRNVLIIDGENSRLVHTRIYPATENCTNRTSKILLKDETSGEATVKTQYIGLAYGDMSRILYVDDADKKKHITQGIELPSFTLNNFSFIENRSKTPSLNENLNMSITNYIHKLSGEILLLPLNFMNKLTSIPEKVRNRKTEMCIRRSEQENDTVVYQLPYEYKIVEIPTNQNITSKFGKYTASVTKKENIITYNRHFELNKGTYPAEDYADFRDFLEQVSTADEVVANLKKQ